VTTIPSPGAPDEATQPIVVRQHGDGTGSAYAPRPAHPLEQVRDDLNQAWSALSEWQARRTDHRTGRSYVTAGHAALTIIDGMAADLRRVRAQLLGEIRRDEDERAVRVDLMLAQWRAERADGTR
jgi:hypothetical protein